MFQPPPQEQSKTNIWKWVVIAILGGVFIAAGWELLRTNFLLKDEVPATAAFAEKQTGEARQDLKIKGNRASGIYHLPGCPNYNEIAEKNVVFFKSHEEAIQAGFRMAKNC